MVRKVIRIDSMSVVQDLLSFVEKNVPSHERIINGLWSVDCLYNPKNNGRIFNYKFIISQTTEQGCSYSERVSYDRNYLESLIGKDFMTENITDIPLLVSLIDSVYKPSIKNYKVEEFSIDEKSSIKLRWRTNIIYANAMKLLNNRREAKIVNVGVVGDILHKFMTEGYYITGTDKDEEITNKKMYDVVSIQSAEKTLDLVANSDLAIITGMTISNNSIEDILQCAKEENTKIIVFAETGYNLAPYFINKGVDVYISEIFPFYIFNGKSTIKVFVK